MYEVLKEIAAAFDREHLEWSVGGSLMLKYHKLLEVAHDIDLVVAAKDAEKADRILKSLGIKKHQRDKGSYSTKFFCEYVIQGIDVDLMSGMEIIHPLQTYKYHFGQGQMQRGEDGIAYGPLEDWLALYLLMEGRENKVKMITDYFSRQGSCDPVYFDQFFDQGLPEEVRLKLESIRCK